MYQQQERQRSGFDPGKPDPIELVFTSFEETDEGRLKREIILENVTAALQNGLLVNTLNLTTQVEKAIKRVRSDSELVPLLKLVGDLYPSMKAQKREPRPLFETLVDKAEAAENLSQRRLYLNAVLAGASVFPQEVSLRLAFASEQDVVTQHQIDSGLQTLEETL